MKTSIRILMLLFIIVFLSKCNSQTPSQAVEIQNPLQLAGIYTFQVTRVAEHPIIQFPSDTLSEDKYKLYSGVKKYEIMFSSKGNRISIQSDSIVGKKSYQTKQQIKFDLLQGVFAGGRFLIWRKGQSIEAEFTIYGSGVPIIRSERGLLIKKTDYSEILPFGAAKIENIKISRNQVIVTTVYGTPNPCWYYYRTESTNDDNIFTSKVFGKYDGDPCIQIIGSFTREEKIIFSSKGVKKLRFWQNDSLYLDTTITLQ